jgi:UDP:flavonoid glycosyltransferase YjiC (YdhE family)
MRGGRPGGVPSVVIANFTWDWIYAAYAEHLPSAPDLIPTIRAAYSHADAAWRLPMHGGFESVRTIRDLPFVARHAKHSRAGTRERLGLPPDRRLALTSFGGYGAHGIAFDRLDCVDAWDVVTTDYEPAAATPKGVRFVHEPALYAAGLRYEDLVAACDVIVTKPGYGIISECLANGVAIVYTSRGRFAEYDVLVRDMPRYLRSAYIEQESLMAGRWRAALDAAMNAPAPPQESATDGAEVVAQMIASQL